MASVLLLMLIKEFTKSMIFPRPRKTPGNPTTILFSQYGGACIVGVRVRVIVIVAKMTDTHTRISVLE